MSWQIYTKRIPPMWNCEEDVSLTSSGISISRKLYDQMGAPYCCVLMFNEEENQIGIVPTNNADEGMRLWAPKNSGTRCFLMAHNFMKEFGLIKYAAETRSVRTDGTLYIIQL